MDEQLQKLVTGFLDDVIWKEPWFLELDSNQAWDSFILAGSHARGDNTTISDIDIFLVLPHESQRTYRIASVHEYQYNGRQFDVSKVTTQKLQSSALDKRNLFWWHHTHLLRTRNDDVRMWHEQAAFCSHDELRDLLWNNYCLFELVREGNLPNTLLQNDLLGTRLCFSSCLQYATDSALATAGIFVSSKKQGALLRQNRNDVYDLLSTVNEAYTPTTAPILLSEVVKPQMVDDLLLQEFLQEEIEAWDKYHTERFLHQAL